MVWLRLLSLDPKRQNQGAVNGSQNERVLENGHLERSSGLYLRDRWPEGTLPGRSLWNKYHHCTLCPPSHLFRAHQQEVRTQGRPTDAAHAGGFCGAERKTEKNGKWFQRVRWKISSPWSMRKLPCSCQLGLSQL